MATLLQTIVEKKHYCFIDREVTWQEAVRLSTESLAADGSVCEDYYKQIIDCIDKYGPYVVFEHNVAMPHATGEVTGAYKAGVGLLISRKAINFGYDEDGEKKEAKLLFTTSAAKGEEHMANITQLIDIFMNVPLLDALTEAETPEDILKAEADHLSKK